MTDLEPDARFCGVLTYMCAARYYKAGRTTRVQVDPAGQRVGFQV